MKPDDCKIDDVFSRGGKIHFILPHFQREYTWGLDEWKTLLEDAFAIYQEYDPNDDTDKAPEHFLGSLVVIDDGKRKGVLSAFKLVDGQQRLITISLLFCAISRIIKTSNPVLAEDISGML